VGPSLDAAVFTQVADRVRNGAALYATTWDHKPPGMYLVLIAAQAVLPFISSWIVSWTLGVLATFGLGMCVAVACSRLHIERRSAAIAALLATALAGQYLFALGGGLTEPVAAVPAGIAFIAALAETPHSARRAAGVGVLCAAGVLVSVQVAAAAVAVGTLMVMRSRERWRTAMWYAVGAAALVLAVVSWLALTGVLAASIAAVVSYGGAYRGIGLSIGWELSRPVVSWSLLAMLVLIAPAAVGARHAFRAGGKRRTVAMALLLWVGLALLSFIVQARFLAHYAIPLVLPLGVLAAMGLERITTNAGNSRLLIPVALCGLLSVAAAVGGGLMEFVPIARDHNRIRLVADAVRQRTTTAEPIWVWGNEPAIYLEADRRNSTAYSYLYPLVTPGYATPRMVEEVVASLQADPPRLIIDAGSDAPRAPGFQPLLIDRPVASDGRDLDLLDPVRAFVAANYRQSTTIDGWVVYVRDS
jgi:hypothetical protein